MIDFHSHILPNVDDGSANLQESITLLNMLSCQGVDTVCATSHFYANYESVSEFLQRRQKAFAELKGSLTKEMPGIILGAEVRYYEGISRLKDLEQLRIQGTNLLLLEMSAIRWSEYTVRELINLSNNSGFTIVLAHIERYFDFQSKEVWERLAQSGIMMQINATSIADRRSKRKTLGMIKKGYFHFIGSDCHSVLNRPPCLDEAFKILEKKFGNEFISSLERFQRSYFEKIANLSK